MDSAPALRAHACKAARGELVDDGALALRAAEVAGRQAAPLTRSSYAGVYRAFCAFLGPDAGPDAVTAAGVRAYRDRLEQEGRSPATIAKQLSALRALAGALGADGVREVRGTKVARGEPRALSTDDYAAAADARPAHDRRQT